LFWEPSVERTTLKHSRKDAYLNEVFTLCNPGSGIKGFAGSGDEWGVYNWPGESTDDLKQEMVRREDQQNALHIYYYSECQTSSSPVFRDCCYLSLDCSFPAGYYNCLFYGRRYPTIGQSFLAAQLLPTLLGRLFPYHRLLLPGPRLLISCWALSSLRSAPDNSSPVETPGRPPSTCRY